MKLLKNYTVNRKQDTLNNKIENSGEKDLLGFRL